MAQNVSPSSAAVGGGDQFQTIDQSKQYAGDVGAPVKDNHSVTKRLQKELMTLMMSAEKDISAFPDSDNIFKWIGTITGADNTFYAGHKYRLQLEFTNAYPYAAPVVKFVTPCFHPNVDLDGTICLDILKDKWSALYDVRTILLSIQSLLGEPNNESPLNAQAAAMWETPKEYKLFLNGFYDKNKDA